MKTILFSLITLVSGMAFAQSNAGYGDAGCGLGSMILGPEQGFTQVFAATTNSTSYTNMFGITSGTSNCTEGGVFKSARQVPAYIEMNKIALAKEAARGEGETLAGLAQLMGCEGNTFGKTLKSNYNEIFVESKMESMQIQNRIQSLTQNTCGA